MRPILISLCLLPILALSGCKKESAPVPTAVAKSTLGIRPNGDTTIGPDPAKTTPEMKKVFDYIDAHIDEHVENFQNWIKQPSISNSGEGIPETAEMVKGMFDKLGCQETKVYDMGMTEWGQPGNPVVYAKCDEGAPKTVFIYWMYDTMPVTQPDLWVSPPFEGKVVEGKTIGLPYPKVLVGRGATNSKGPEITELNALMSMKAANGKLPVNVIFVAEGDEERMSMGLRKFVTTHPELLKPADAMLMFGFQGLTGGASMMSGSEGLMYIELTTSGTAWGRGPTKSDIHGVFKRAVDSPAWRHIKMLSSITSDDGNSPKIKGFTDGIVPLTPAEDAKIKAGAAHADLKVAAENLGVARFISDDPYVTMKALRSGTAFNLDGIWGGNMYAGGSGAILPNKITSKHSIRYMPNMHSADILKAIRAQLDANGYKDVQLRLIGDQPWSKGSADSDIGHALAATLDQFSVPHEPISSEASAVLSSASAMAGAWPAYLFTDHLQGDPNIVPLNIPICGAGIGYGGGAHAANEYFVIEGSGKVYGMAGAEKFVAASLYNYAAMPSKTPLKSGK
ncbi:Acetylornithine deacetylase/Succinyl-diaminopimelate desuccinylase [Granulicella rosea]|uniref:Acetylornithine deacetylase/Succinyl-diaminopimelate desuccinylase n=1 Tax=Granulicella rosea TaxID=474952 RepID=A0A239EGV1_9BACT|nr:M20/M25/M40 family metallo-hydrolase [Granulicella rosea]SNS43876.1 Acetylornithine deacetylase/Succinyl-diaminopimelate desuccinylase [Granulicella rosea]